MRTEPKEIKTEPQEQSSNEKKTDSEKPTEPVKNRPNRIKRLLLLLLSLYVGMCVMLAIIQRKLIYFPTKEDSLSIVDLHLSPERFHDVSVKTINGLTLHGWHVLPPGRVAMDEQERQWELEQGRPVILFFPGNAGHRGYRSSELDQLSGLNADLFLFDHRGYAENAGIPSEKNFQHDAKSIWDYLIEVEGIAPGRILILGESLGGGVATTLTNELIAEGIEPGGLFLKTTFSSLVDAARSRFWWLPCSLIMTERYESAKKIKEITCPISILHGINDEIIPFELSERLYVAAPEKSKTGVPKAFIELPAAGHNNVLQVNGEAYLEAVSKMLRNIKR